MMTHKDNWSQETVREKVSDKTVVRALKLEIPLAKFLKDPTHQELAGTSLFQNALLFLPKKEVFNPSALLMLTHGYTASKDDQISWATRTSQEGFATLIFDLPGHFLGGSEGHFPFEYFTEITIDLFHQWHEILETSIQEIYQIPTNDHSMKDSTLILGGHSLGAMMSVHYAHDLQVNRPELKTSLFLIGFGINELGKNHLFQSKFYQNTLNIRGQFVIDELHPDQMFPWIRSQKEQSHFENLKICLITGQNDVVVGEKGVKNLYDKFDPQKNDLVLIEPKDLPHHRPELATGHFFAAIKKQHPELFNN